MIYAFFFFFFLVPVCSSLAKFLVFFCSIACA